MGRKMQRGMDYPGAPEATRSVMPVHHRWEEGACRYLVKVEQMRLDDDGQKRGLMDVSLTYWERESCSFQDQQVRNPGASQQGETKVGCELFCVSLATLESVQCFLALLGASALGSIPCDLSSG